MHDTAYLPASRGLWSRTNPQTFYPRLLPLLLILLLRCCINAQLLEGLENVEHGVLAKQPDVSRACFVSNKRFA